MARFSSEPAVSGRTIKDAENPRELSAHGPTGPFIPVDSLVELMNRLDQDNKALKARVEALEARLALPANR